MRMPGTIIEAWTDDDRALLSVFYTEGNGRRTEYTAQCSRATYDLLGAQGTRDLLERQIRTQRRKQQVLGEPDMLFVWTTDLHFGQSLNRSSRSEIFARICSLNPAFIVDTGDSGDTSAAAEYVEFKAQIAALTVPFYYMPGDHDEGWGLDITGQTPGEIATYDTWLAAGLDMSFVVDAGPFRLISAISYKIRAPNPLRGKGALTAEMVARIETQCAAAAAAGKIPIVCTHHPLSSIEQLDGGAYASAFELLTSNGCHNHWGGHLHYDCFDETVSGVHYVVGGSLWINGPVDARTLDSGFHLCEVYSTPTPRIDISYIRARPPWDVYGPVAQAVGDATYTPMITVMIALLLFLLSPPRSLPSRAGRSRSG